jgi:Flp pilus assembly secretin CpaC
MTPKLRACFVGVQLLLAAMSSAAWAADQTVTLRLGTGATLTLQRPFKAVLVGDPDVVDVHEQGDRAVVLEPLQLGATNLVFVDERSIAMTNIRILVCRAGATRTKYQDAPHCEETGVKEKPGE